PLYFLLAREAIFLINNPPHASRRLPSKQWVFRPPSPRGRRAAALHTMRATRTHRTWPTNPRCPADILGIGHDLLAQGVGLASPTHRGRGHPPRARTRRRALALPLGARNDDPSVHGVAPP